MKLSSILHKLINDGRNGRTGSSKATPIKLTDEQLCEMWSKASDLEAKIEKLKTGMRRLIADA